MSTHSVSEAKSKLSKLINRALKGEAVVITRRRQPVVELRAVRPPVRAITPDDLDWLARRRIPRLSNQVPARW